MDLSAFDWTMLDPVRLLLPFPIRLHLVSLVAAVAMTYLCAHPVLAFLRRGWEIRREDILSSLDDNAKTLYLESFLHQTVTDACKQFDKMYTHRYGRYRLTVPLIFLLVVVLALSYLVAENAILRIGFSSRLMAPHVGWLRLSDFASSPGGRSPPSWGPIPGLSSS